MLRIILMALTVAITAPALAQSSEPLAVTPRLRATATVQDNVVRIGDLIENAGKLADVAIFQSPDLGGTGTVSAADVLTALRAHDLLIVDTAGVRDITVMRAAREISARDIQQSVARAFAGKDGLGDADKLAITFEREPRTLYFESQATADLKVSRANYNPRTQRFDIVFYLPGSTLAQQIVMRYGGTLFEGVMVPVLTRPVNRGETIRASDISIEKRPKPDITSDTFSDKDHLLGFTARQSLRAGQPLRRADLAKPEMVKRDEFVTLLYQIPGVTLTIRGKAVDSGAIGDVIGVVNVQSKRTVQGTITGPGRVTMTSTPSLDTAETAAAAPAAVAQNVE